MIPIYQPEINDGLGETIQKNNSFAFEISLKPSNVRHENEKTVFEKIIASKANIQANPDQIDLFYLESVLASVGVSTDNGLNVYGWNNNTDIFTKAESWAARNSPVDKQFNYMHNEQDIIGHLTSAWVVDLDGNIIPDDTVLENVPNCFDICVGSVLYLGWKDEVLRERMKQLIAGIKQGKWAVSMECLFAGFDYGLRKDNEFKIVARNEQSSFLTKYLRSYGGNGYFDGWELGRVIRDFLFSGKGLVDKPANKNSVIINSYSAAADDKTNVVKTDNGEDIMSEKTVSIEQYEALQAELKNLTDAQHKAVAAEIAALTKEVASLKDDNANLQISLDNSNKLSQERDASIRKLEAAIQEKETKIVELTKSLADIEAAKKQTERISQLVAVGVTEEDAVKIVEKFVTANDDMFGEVVALRKSMTAASQSTDTVTDTQDADAAKASLDNAEPDNSPNLSDSGEDVTTTLRTQASAWLVSAFDSK